MMISTCDNLFTVDGERAKKVCLLPINHRGRCYGEDVRTVWAKAYAHAYKLADEAVKSGYDNSGYDVAWEVPEVRAAVEVAERYQALL